jgi:hypothetical protein
MQTDEGHRGTISYTRAGDIHIEKRFLVSLDMFDGGG